MGTDGFATASLIPNQIAESTLQNDGLLRHFFVRQCRL